MGKEAQINNRAIMHKNIPYRYCFEEGGMIETEKGIYSRTFKILPPDEDVKGSYHSKKTRMVMGEILQKLAENFTYQFTIRNCHMDREEYLSKVMLEESEKEDAYQHLRTLYNKVLQDNCDIGHNNFTREVYLTISTEADMPEIALEKFLESESWMKEMFHSLYGFQMKALELTERLELLYDIYHPEQNRTKFGDKVDYDGTGFSIKSMQRMKMDTKDTTLVKGLSKTKEAILSQDYIQQHREFVETMKNRKSDFTKVPKRKAMYVRENLVGFSNLPMDVVHALIQMDIPEVYVDGCDVAYPKKLQAHMEVFWEENLYQGMTAEEKAEFKLSIEKKDDNRAMEYMLQIENDERRALKNPGSISPDLLNEVQKEAMERMKEKEVREQIMNKEVAKMLRDRMIDKRMEQEVDR